MITGFTLGVASSMILLLVIFVVAQNLKRSGGKNLLPKLEASTKRLQLATADLLARADEIDQESRFVAGGMRPEFSQRLAKACSDLVLLEDAVKVVEARIQTRELNLARQDLLSSLSVARSVRSSTNCVRRSAGEGCRVSLSNAIFAPLHVVHFSFEKKLKF